MSAPNIRFIEKLDLSRIADPPQNPNSMSERDFAALEHNIEEEGFLQPILVQELSPDPDTMFEIVDGVHRTGAARNKGYTHLPAMVLPHDYPAEKVKLLQIGMNRLRGNLDHTEVARTLADLGEGWDLSLSGFDPSQIKGMMEAIEPPDMDDLLSTGMEPEPKKIDKPDPIFSLDIELESAEQLRAVKKALRDRGGKGNKDLAVGLLKALDIDQ